MSVRWQRILAVAAAVLVLIGGAGYGVMRPKEYESHAALFLVPATTDIGKASLIQWPSGRSWVRSLPLAG